MIRLIKTDPFVQLIQKCEYETDCLETGRTNNTRKI